MSEMSLRQIAKELGVSHTLLSLWRQGKRTLAPELEARYRELVTFGYTSFGYKSGAMAPSTELKLAAPPGFEPGLKDSKSSVLPLHHRAARPTKQPRKQRHRLRLNEPTRRAQRPFLRRSRFSTQETQVHAGG